MAIELDRIGVPQYDGSPETFNGHEERAWDLCLGRRDKPAERASTALHLCSGLLGPAYEAVLITRDPSDENGQAGADRRRCQIAAEHFEGRDPQHCSCEVQ